MALTIANNLSEPVFLIDSNIILDILINRKDNYTAWSLATIAACSEQGILAINQIIYAEISSIFADLNELDQTVIDYQKIPLPWEAAYLAGKAFAKYRKSGGKRHILMPDFYIGAHATYSRLKLVTRDRGYKNYFPTLQIISPH